MKKVIGTLKEYLLHRIPVQAILLSFFLAATATFFEYRFHLKRAWFDPGENLYLRAILFFGVPVVVFLMLWYFFFSKHHPKQTENNPWNLSFLLVFTLVAFSVRNSFQEHSTWVYHHFENWEYGIRLVNAIILGPMMSLFAVVWWWTMDRKREARLYGCSLKGVSWSAYFLLLLAMLPLVALASTQKDFIAYYPKVARLFSEEFPLQKNQAALYELFYGLDFVYIEFFFRRFLVIAFARFLGPVSIPFAALMYCTIHFGKPLGETISSWFGGMILGILVYETRSIAGGIVVHMGIAWLMELGGFIGRL
ncbi:MAG: CPBP family intramembrane metalloprotease [Bacteroidota bacterium]|nr:CPBP family intramembrane metalloprotease [Bacteroidota bacterium]MDX5431877.1 CPBP family intramembrane metalloprotease [Bacteroidota bacterium]MDX5470591.1 CPBP family intramembrane metalloprotease [Bacteroidota bacterium]